MENWCNDYIKAYRKENDNNIKLLDKLKAKADKKKTQDSEVDHWSRD